MQQRLARPFSVSEFYSLFNQSAIGRPSSVSNFRMKDALFQIVNGALNSLGGCQNLYSLSRKEAQASLFLDISYLRSHLGTTKRHVSVFSGTFHWEVFVLCLRSPHATRVSYFTRTFNWGVLPVLHLDARIGVIRRFERRKVLAPSQI